MPSTDDTNDVVESAESDPDRDPDIELDLTGSTPSDDQGDDTDRDSDLSSDHPRSPDPPSGESARSEYLDEYLAAAIRDADVAEAIFGRYDLHAGANLLFPAPSPERDLAVHLQEHLEAYGDVPTDREWSAWLDDSNHADERRRTLAQRLGRLMEHDPSWTKEHLIDHATDNLRAMAEENAVKELQTLDSFGLVSTTV